MNKVLIVDDDHDVLETLKTILAEKGFQVHTVDNQDEIYDNILAFKPKAILLDVKLKGADGRNICQGLKSHYMTKEIPIILFSADQKLKDTYQECLADAFIEKPVRLHKLVKRLKDYCYIPKGGSRQMTA